MSAHIHAELMKQYAEDAMVTDKPWELWEVLGMAQYLPLYAHPSWHDEATYRRKPKTININGFEVPEPYRGEMKGGQKYYPVDPQAFLFQYGATWCDASIDRRWKDRSFIHLTEEAAALHGKALASFTSGDTNA